MKYFFILIAALISACSDESPFEEPNKVADEAYSEHVADENNRNNCTNKDKYDSWCCNNYNITCKNPKFTYSECENTSKNARVDDSYCCSNYSLRCPAYSSSSIFLRDSSDLDSSNSNSSSSSEIFSSSSSSYLSSSSYQFNADECLQGYGTATKCCEFYNVRCSVSSSSNYSSSSNVYSSSSSKNYTQSDCVLGYGSDTFCCENYNIRCPSYSYLTTSKTLTFTLTEYKQVTSNWDALDDPGDPMISFSINTYDQYNALLKSFSTGVLLNKNNTRYWTGTSSTTITIPIYTYKIEVCPKVIDDDILDDDNYSSGKCYSVTSVGYLDDYKIEKQNDYNSSNYKLYWEWYLY